MAISSTPAPDQEGAAVIPLIGPAVELGDIVIYRSRDGRRLAAIVTATPDEFDPRLAPDGAAIPNPGELSLLVFRVGGSTYPRHLVKWAGMAAEGERCWEAKS